MDPYNDKAVQLTTSEGRGMGGDNRDGRRNLRRFGVILCKYRGIFLT